jgi:uncharacterized lipoprotein YmbA
MTQALARALSAALGSTRVTTNGDAVPWTGDRIAVQVLAFGSKLDGESRIEARWEARRGDIVRPGSLTVQESARGGYEALVRAHSRALSRLAREIAASVVALDGSPSVAVGNRR